MGKSTNMLNGVISGKVGAQVGFKTQDSKRPQGVRAYQPTVSNPKSAKQAAQRCKIVAAQQMYASFEPVLNHAFFPKGKASKNMRRFMSLALKLSGIPNVPKGSGWMGYNMPYKMSEGTLGLDSLAQAGKFVSAGHGEDLACKGLRLASASTIDSTTKVGAFSTELIAQNPQLKDGYEITFLVVAHRLGESSVGDMYGVYGSIVLDTTDQLNTLGDLCKGFGFANVNDSTYGHVLAITFNDMNSPVYGTANIVAGAVVISAKSKTSWKYTNSYLGMTGHGIDGYDVDEEAIITSYMSSGSNADSDLILQQADNNQAASEVTIVSVTNETYTPSPVVAGATYSNAKAAVATYSNGQKKVVVNDGTDELVNYAQNVFDPVTVTVDSETSNLIIDATTWDGAPTVDVSTVQQAGF